MIRYEELKALARQNGFDATAKLNMDALIFREEIRDMCRADRCRAFGKSWRCPPVIGSIEDSFQKTKNYKCGIILQTIGCLEDDFDYETMSDTMKKHSESFIRMMKVVKQEHTDVLGMGAGTCNRCAKCTYPDAPCRFPDESYSSLEAYGLWVSDVCIKSGIPYNNGKMTITYVSCILFSEEYEDNG